MCNSYVSWGHRTPQDERRLAGSPVQALWKVQCLLHAYRTIPRSFLLSTVSAQEVWSLDLPSVWGGTRDRVAVIKRVLTLPVSVATGDDWWAVAVAASFPLSLWRLAGLRESECAVIIISSFIRFYWLGRSCVFITCKTSFKLWEMYYFETHFFKKHYLWQ